MTIQRMDHVGVVVDDLEAATASFIELTADFHCREGWSRLGERWRGVRLRTLLALAGAADAAGYVTIGSG